MTPTPASTRKKLCSESEAASRNQKHAPPQSERDFQRAVTDLLTLRGWRWTHFRPARTDKGYRTPLSGSPGFPDIVAVRDRILFIELKSESGKFTSEQKLWLGDLLLVVNRPNWCAATHNHACTPPCEVYVFKPRDWPEIMRVLE